MTRLGAAIILFLLLSMAGWGIVPATAQPFDDPNAASYERGDAVVMNASPRFSKENLGYGYRLDLRGIEGAPVVRDTIITDAQTDSGIWLRRRMNDFTLNVEASAVGMVDRTLPADSPRRILGVTLYRLDRVERIRLPSVRDIEATQGRELLLTRLYYGWSLNFSIVGTKDTFTPDAIAAVRKAFADKTPLEPVLRRYNLEIAASSRGLVTRVPWTNVPERIPLDWNGVAEQYPLEEPEPVFAEYTLLTDLRPTPIPW
jgi:hypothetical protein